jgi:hypothetical protein
LGFGVVQGLGVSIDGDEFNTLNPGLNHAVDGSATGSANANYFDTSECFNFGSDLLWHIVPCPHLIYY